MDSLCGKMSCEHEACLCELSPPAGEPAATRREFTCGASWSVRLPGFNDQREGPLKGNIVVSQMLVDVEGNGTFEFALFEKFLLLWMFVAENLSDFKSNKEKTPLVFSLRCCHA